jgi:hypothetical protein
MLLVVSVLPYLSLGVNIHTTEGERFLYLPSIFATILLIHFITSFNYRIQFVLYFFALAYNLFFLSHANSYYTTASEIARTTFEEINSLTGKRRLFIDSLPVSRNGALIFRLGFEEGLYWLKQNGRVDSVIVVSLKKNNENWNRNYEVQNPEVHVQQPLINF